MQIAFLGTQQRKNNRANLDEGAHRASQITNSQEVDGNNKMMGKKKNTL